MYRVLIADDEQWIRRWLEKTIPGLGMELEVTAVAEDGEQALALLKRGDIDIVVTDIRMPFLTGLQLAREVRALEKPPKFIFVSGYDEFSYAREAIQLQGMGYLLKPIAKEELSATLSRTVKALEREQTLSMDKGIFEDLLRNTLQDALAHPKGNAPDRLVRLFQQKAISYNRYFAGMLQSGGAGEDAVKCAQTLLKSCFSEGLNCVVQEDPMGCLFFSFWGEGRSPKTVNGRALQAEARKGGGKYRVALSGAYRGLDQLYQAVTEVRGCMLQDYLEESPQAPVEVSRSRFLAVQSSALLAIRSHNQKELRANIQTFREMLLYNMKTNGEKELELCKRRVFHLINETAKLVTEADGAFSNPLVEKGYAFCTRLYGGRNIPAMMDWYAEYAEEVAAYLEKSRSLDVSQLVFRVRDYLLEHYSEDVSLSSICDQFGVNASYFSKKFKDGVGMNFVDFLTRIRVDAACQLLSTTDRPVADISHRVGIRDAKYFSKVFQNSCGVSPTQYREAAPAALEKENEK